MRKNNAATFATLYGTKPNAYGKCVSAQAKLEAIGRLGRLAEEYVSDVLPEITSALDDSDPQVRGMAVWCLAQVGRTGVLVSRPDLASDAGPVDLYENGQFGRTSVGRLAQRALGDGPAPPRQSLQ